MLFVLELSTPTSQMSSISRIKLENQRRKCQPMIFNAEKKKRGKKIKKNKKYKTKSTVMQAIMKHPVQAAVFIIHVI